MVLSTNSMRLDGAETLANALVDEEPAVAAAVCSERDSQPAIPAMERHTAELPTIDNRGRFGATIEAGINDATAKIRCCSDLRDRFSDLRDRNLVLIGSRTCFGLAERSLIRNAKLLKPNRELFCQGPE